MNPSTSTALAPARLPTGTPAAATWSTCGALLAAATAFATLILTSPAAYALTATYAITGTIQLSSAPSEIAVNDVYQIVLTINYESTDSNDGDLGRFEFALVALTFDLIGPSVGSYAGGALASSARVATTENVTFTHAEFAPVVSANLGHQTTFAPFGGTPFKELSLIMRLALGAIDDTGFGQTLYSVLRDRIFTPDPSIYYSGTMGFLSQNASAYGSIDLIQILEQPGASQANPLVPLSAAVAPAIFEGVCSETTFCFTYALGTSGPGVDQSLWIDPPPVVGYDYEVVDGPAITALEPPVGNEGTFGDDRYDVFVFDDGAGDFVLAGVATGGAPFDLTALDPAGFTRVRVLGIETSAELTATNPLAFPSGLRFAAGDESVAVTMTALVEGGTTTTTTSSSTSSTAEPSPSSTTTATTSSSPSTTLAVSTTTTAITTTTLAATTAFLRGTTLAVKQSKSGEQRLTIVAKDPAVASGACETAGELVIEASGAGAPATTLPLEAGAWKPIDEKHPAKGCTFTGSTVTKALLKSGKMLKIVARGTGLGVPLTTDPRPVRIALRHGATRHCLEFGGRGKHTPGKKLLGKQAPTASACPG